MIYDKIQEKNPELCGFTAEEFDKEENKWLLILITCLLYTSDAADD